ncbi:class I SAM-dependent methyltransferase [Streptomyces sp. NBC_01022]|uniref:class I SAM-dependent methyltransferase n=1 Tax=Streptomyces sp. NBC_01022 TaxID=2903723 RepID=UPI002DD914A5|nr:class I SAM-dependent methyltransferase [Streptomyces sp. NBC_01022]WRZ85680.1 class I SAM-dependent methyltransferase [Streptomyces sp. NBC_01022]
MTVTEAWNGLLGQHWAAHPDRYNAMLDGFDGPLFDAAAIGPGDRVVDIGCGSGLTTRMAAHRAPGGRVTGVDISEPLVGRARALTDGAQFPHVTYRLGDAQTCAFEPGGYDLAISRGGVMFFADPVAAFTNIAGALRPGGRLVFLCPQPAQPDGEERKALGLLASLLGRDHTTENAVATAMASLSEPERIHEVLGAAGFTDIEVTGVSADTCWGKDAADAVEFFVSRTPGLAVSDATRAAMTDALLPHESPRGVLLRAGVWVVTAHTP